MPRRIVIVQGHPDPAGDHFCHALANAYAEGARKAGHEVRVIEIAKLEFPILRSKNDFDQGTPVLAIHDAQQTVAWSEHLVFVYPLWLGAMPALLKAFLEQLLRPGFSHRIATSGRVDRLLKGRSARIVVTMGMPTLVYRWFFGAHSVKAFRRGVLWLCGIAPVHHTLIGAVETSSQATHARWIERLRALGAVAG